MLSFEYKSTKVLYLSRSKNIKISPFFSKSEYHLLETDGFKKAVSIIEDDFDIDIIVETVRSSGAENVDFLKYVKSSEKFRYIPYIVICEKPDKSIITKFISSGANDIIIEYDKRDVVLEKVKKALENGRKKVLIVDDDNTILDYLKFVVQLERFKVLTADTGEKALEIFNSEKIDVVISDIVMPGMTGLDLLAKIKDIDSNTPVLLITGQVSRYSENSVTDNGADGYLKKPFRNTELIQTLREVTHTL